METEVDYGGGLLGEEDTTHRDGTDGQRVSRTDG